jgi:hypothetical protein
VFVMLYTTQQYAVHAAIADHVFAICEFTTLCVGIHFLLIPSQTLILLSTVRVTFTNTDDAILHTCACFYYY